MRYSPFFLTELLKLGVLFSTAVRTVVVGKLVILGILLLTSFILALRVVLVAKLVISVILSSKFFTSYASFSTASFFTTSLSLLNQQEQVLIYQHLSYVLYFSIFLN